MSLRSAPYFWVICDCCGYRADYGDYSAWSDAGQAIDSLENADFCEVGDEHFCSMCWKWSDADDRPIRSHETHPGASA